MFWRRSLAVLALCALPLSPAAAETYTVFPDGSGDFPTIQQAIDAAGPGDMILLGNGIYRGTGNRDLHYLGKSITVRAQGDNPDLCILDCEGSPGNLHRAVTFDGEGPGSVLQGVTITNGFVDDTSLPFPESCGGALLFVNGASPTVTNVIMRGCAASAGGGAVVWSGSPHFTGCRFEGNGACGGGGGYCFAGSPQFTNCEFVENMPVQGAGGMGCSNTNQVSFTGCAFINNLSLHGGWGAGLRLINTSARVTRCTFVGNSNLAMDPGDRQGCTYVLKDPDEQSMVGGAINVLEADVIISECTIVGNAGLYGGGIGVEYCESSPVQIQNCILAFSTAGGAVSCSSPADLVTLTCCDLYGNTGGDWAGCIAGQYGVNGNISLDPRFCDPSVGDYTLFDTSPCAPENGGPCGLIGAWPVGCGPTAVEGAEGALSFGIKVFPNPGPGDLRIELRLPGAECASVSIVDVTGRRIRGLPGVTGTTSFADDRELTWDGRDDEGRPVRSGIYYLRVETASGVASRQVVIAR